MENSVMENASDLNQAQSEPVAQVIEKMVPQSQVNEIVGNAKRESAERAVEAYKRQQVVAPQQVHEPNAYRNMSEDDIKRLTGDAVKQHFSQVEQQFQERANADAAKRIVSTFTDKIVAGKDKFQDFEAVTGNVAMQYYPNVVQLLAEHTDNTADVLYHLAKNRDKLYRLEGLSSHNASDAIYEMKRLSESIRANEESSQAKHPNAPLSQQRPSNTGTDSGSSLSMNDLKRKYRG